MCDRRILVATLKSGYLAANPVGAVAGGILADRQVYIVSLVLGGNSDIQTDQTKQKILKLYCLHCLIQTVRFNELLINQLNFIDLNYLDCFIQIVQLLNFRYVWSV